ncbi:MAG: cytochrome c [Aureispira sp.]|nr:cytochrome c [Aureispira sp.]
MKNLIYIAFIAITAGSMVASCGRAGGEDTGHEYMPDMAHSIAYEANYNSYYRNNTWGTEEDYRKMAEPRKPVANTIARGESVYHYEESERERAMAELNNAVTPANQEELDDILTRGGNLYNIYCAVCHGEEGNGNGPLYNNGDGPYPARPASFISDDFIKAGNSDGRFYHAIVYGKGVMQSHTDKLNPEERWEVIHYIRSLQGIKSGTAYDINAVGAVKVNVAPDTTAVEIEEPAHDEHAPH